MEQKRTPHSRTAGEETVSQRELTALLRASPERGMEALFSQYRGYCYRVAYEILRCREDAEECVDDVLLRAGEALRAETPRCLRAYLAAAARNQAVTRIRREQCAKRIGGRDTVPLLEGVSAGTGSLEETVCDGTLIRQCLQNVLRKFTPQNRALFVGRYEAGLSVSALAEEFSLSEACVRSRLFRMRSRLRRELRRCGVTV